MLFTPELIELVDVRKGGFVIKTKEGKIETPKPGVVGEVVDVASVNEEICMQIFGKGKVGKKEYEKFLEFVDLVNELTAPRIKKQFEK